jgi:hypothetical protein
VNLARLAEDRVKEQGERVVLIFEDREITNAVFHIRRSCERQFFAFTLKLEP